MRLFEDFTGIARLRDDSEFVEICSSAARELKQNIEMNAWDGKWYRRAYFDDGTPLGSSGNQECQIDSISQSWSVLSGAAPAESFANCHEIG
jgi:cyclic beta-1,2-glucan synthetase